MFAKREREREVRSHFGEFGAAVSRFESKRENGEQKRPNIPFIIPSFFLYFLLNFIQGNWLGEIWRIGCYGFTLLFRTSLCGRPTESKDGPATRDIWKPGKRATRDILSSTRLWDSCGRRVGAITTLGTSPPPFLSVSSVWQRIGYQHWSWISLTDRYSWFSGIEIWAPICTYGPFRCFTNQTFRVSLDP